MKALIIDNEVNIIEGLKSLLGMYCPEITHVDSAMNIKDGLQKINNYKPDILFLDIELDEGTGIDLLNRIGDCNFQIIFITAYNKYALEAFKYSAIDYLLKPIDPDDLVRSVNKAKDVIDRKNDQVKFKVLVNNMQSLSRNEKKIIVSDKDNLYAMELKSILYLKADGPYTKIVRVNDSILASKNLKHFEGLLIYSGFCRIHHSYLANLSQMKKFDKADSVLELTTGESIPVSVRKRESLVNAIKAFHL